MKFSIIPDQDALSKCAWCTVYIGDETDAYAVGATLSQTTDLSEFETHCVEIILDAETKTVPMLVTPKGSEAKHEGHDGMFLVCSEQCANSLKAAVNKEISSGEMFKSVQDILG